MRKGRERPASGRLEFQGQNLLVGLFVVVAVGLFIAGSLTAMREGLFLREYRLRTSFDRIEGLRAGAEVLLRGYHIGEVTSIKLTTAPEVLFHVEFSVQNAIQLPRGSRVRLMTRGFGNKVLDIVTAGDTTVQNPPIPPADPADTLQEGDSLPSERGNDLDALLGDLTRLTRKLTGTIERVDRLVDEGIAPVLRSTKILLDQDVSRTVSELQGASASARRLTERLQEMVEEHRPLVARILDLTEEELETARDLTQDAQQFLVDMDLRLDPFFAELTATLEHTKSLLAEVDAATDEEQLREIMQDLRAMADEGAALVEEVRQRPWRLLRRTRKEKKELMREIEERERLEQEAIETGQEDDGGSSP